MFTWAAYFCIISFSTYDVRLINLPVDKDNAHTIVDESCPCSKKQSNVQGPIQNTTFFGIDSGSFNKNIPFSTWYFDWMSSVFAHRKHNITIWCWSLFTFVISFSWVTILYAKSLIEWFQCCMHKWMHTERDTNANCVHEYRMKRKNKIIPVKVSLSAPQVFFCIRADLAIIVSLYRSNFWCSNLHTYNHTNRINRVVSITLSV